MNHGISTLHGPHHVAQKSSSMTLPLSGASFTSLPSTSFSVKFRFAGLAFAATGRRRRRRGARSRRRPRASKCVSDETRQRHHRERRQRDTRPESTSPSQLAPQPWSPGPNAATPERTTPSARRPRAARARRARTCGRPSHQIARFVPEHFDELFRPRRLRQHEQATPGCPSWRYMMCAILPSPYRHGREPTSSSPARAGSAGRCIRQPKLEAIELSTASTASCVPNSRVHREAFHVIGGRVPPPCTRDDLSVAWYTNAPPTTITSEAASANGARRARQRDRRRRRGARRRRRRAA